ncbi:MAG TPA: universal stress protein [Thermoleophilaceae bacterium]|nr:universal stress protein [Thermoleophilaceae bacterium]
MDATYPIGKRLVCGIGDLGAEQKVAGVAARLGADMGCGVTLVHVIGSVHPLPLGLRPPGPLRARRARRELALVAGGRRFPPGTGVRIESGDPLDSLTEVAQEEDAELLVVGAREAGSATSLLPGGVTSALIRKSPCPVVVVPQEAVRPPEAGPIAAVVCGVEGEDLDVPVLRLAADLARRLPAELHAVHAYDPLVLGAIGMAAPAPPVDLDLREAAERTLLNALEEADVAAHEHVIELPPDLALRRIAGEERAGLIVVGARDRSKLTSLLHGSVPMRLAGEGNTTLVVLPEAARLESGSGHYEVMHGAA